MSDKPIQIDAERITDFHRSQAELEALLLFSIVVAGKTSSVMQKKVNAILKYLHERGETHFFKPSASSRIALAREHKVGKYSLLIKALFHIHSKYKTVYSNLATVSLEDLLAIPGVGPKTARMFLLHTRPNVRYAVLDVHILRYMYDQGLTTEHIKQTPSSKKYKELEEILLKHVDSLNKNYADFDLDIWVEYSGKNK